MSDVAAVIADQGEKRAVIVGHDWGGATAWALAMHRPELAERLIVLNMPHPWTLARLLVDNPEQRKNANTRAISRTPTTTSRFRWSGSAAGSRIPRRAPRTLRSDATLRSAGDDALLPGQLSARALRAAARLAQLVKVPTLLIHGLGNKALLSEGLNGVWNYVASDLTITTSTGAGHFVQQDAAELVSRTMLAWLLR